MTPKIPNLFCYKLYVCMKHDMACVPETRKRIVPKSGTFQVRVTSLMSGIVVVVVALFLFFAISPKTLFELRRPCTTTSCPSIMYEEHRAHHAHRVEPLQLDHLPQAYPSSESHALFPDVPHLPPSAHDDDTTCAQQPRHTANPPLRIPPPQPQPQPPPPVPKHPSSPSSTSSSSSASSRSSSPPAPPCAVAHHRPLPPPTPPSAPPAPPPPPPPPLTTTPRRIAGRGRERGRRAGSLNRRGSDGRLKDDKNDSLSSSSSAAYSSSSITRLNISKTKGVNSSSTSNRSPNALLRSDVWIIQYHDEWSRFTLSLFYKAVEERTLSPAQYTCWLIDRTSISIKVLEAATRTNEMLKCSKPRMTLPLLSTAKENAEFLAQYIVLNGFDINPNRRLSNAARKLEDVLEASTAPDAASLISAITAVWAFMLACWQAWALCKRRGCAIPPHFAPIAEHLARDESISSLVDTQAVLDKLLQEQRGAAGKKEFEKAGKIFHDVVTKACAVLDHTMAISDSNHVPLCTCGRKGHLPSQCTFKSHI